MHFAGLHHLLLGRVPQIVMGLSLFELRQSINVFPMVVAMLIEGLLGPLGKTGKGIILEIVKAEIVGKLPPHD